MSAWHDPLLPSNQTRLEAGLTRSAAPRNTPEIIAATWNPDTCPERLLPWLAWAFSAEEWDDAWPESRKREEVRNARAWHHQKGTPSAVLNLLARLGHPDAVLVERALERGHGLVRGIGLARLPASQAWATYMIRLQRPVTEADAQLIARLLRRVDRACCHLIAIQYRQTPIRRGEGYRRAEGYRRGLATIVINPQNEES